MNIRRISDMQKGTFNTSTNRWGGINCFKEYVGICLGRRTYKHNKRLTFSIYAVSKQQRKAQAYKDKITSNKWIKAAGER